MKTLLKILPIYLLPILAFAAPTDLTSLIDTFIGIIALAIPVIIALAVLYFFWGLAKFILSAGGGNEKEEAKDVMVWGIVALFVMVAVWGIVAVLQTTFII